MIEDITQDPEYIKGYEQGVKEHNRQFTPKSRGFSDGWDAAALASQKTVESRPMPSQSEQKKTLDERLDELDERLKKLEKYTQE